MEERISFKGRLKLNAVSLITGILISTVFLLLGALLVSNVNMPHSILTLISSISLTLGSVASGFMVGAVKKTKGLFEGILAGVVLFLAVFLASFFVSGEIGITALFKLIICALSGAVGGIIGVNKR